MRGGLRIIGVLSITLLVCVLIGQAVWITKIKELKLNEFRQVTTFVLSEVMNGLLDGEVLGREYHFTCGLDSDGKTFTWGEKDQSVEISSYRNFYEMLRLVFYDHLYQHNFLYLEKVDSIYRQRLQMRGISERPVLMIWETSGQTLMTTDSLHSFEGELFTKPIDLGYEYRHQVVAAFPEPLIFRSMIWHLVMEGIFLIGFALCLIWQWRVMRMAWQSAKVQTMGMAHLEHELKKPLAAMISAIGGIADRKGRELTEVQDLKLKMVKARLMKMAEITDTMLTTLKTSELKVERKPVNIRQEMELVEEMFRVLRPHAKIHVQIEEGIEQPLLDAVYFNYLVINLVDNAIKYGGDRPEVDVRLGKEGKAWILTVTDNGIGMPGKALKRIFRQFYRVKDKRVAAKTGFGLGLAFVKKVVDAYGGKITVESEEGKGSRFKIMIDNE